MVRNKPHPPFRLLWITDPWDYLDHPNDTTLRLAKEACILGHKSFWCDVKSIRWDRGRIVVDVRELTVRKGILTRSKARKAAPSKFDQIHYRVDPPVDFAYLHPLHLLTLGLPDSSKKLVNPSAVLSGSYEKTEAARIDSLMPATLISSRWEDLERFGKQERKTVLKPLHSCQSKGVELLEWHSKEAVARSRRLLKQASENFRLPVVLQRYLPGIRQGEQRLWFVDGKFLANVKKLPLASDFRVNVDRGSQLTASPLNARDQKAKRAIERHLQKRGIRLAAVDVIDGQVTDFNFTSPGLIVQMEGVLNQNLARPIIQALTWPDKLQYENS